MRCMTNILQKENGIIFLYRKSLIKKVSQFFYQLFVTYQIKKWSNTIFFVGLNHLSDII